MSYVKSNYHQTAQKEGLTARYLFAKSIFGFIGWGIMAVRGFKQHPCIK